MRWRNRDPDAEGAELLVAEVEQFLEGHYLDVLFDSRREVPAWAWLSLLTHGDEETLRELETWNARHGASRPELETWVRVLQLLARRLLAMSETIPYSVVEIQRELLVPLEIAIMTSPIGPATMYRVVISMLEHARARLGSERT